MATPLEKGNQLNLVIENTPHLFVYILVKPKSNVLSSLKLTNWYRVGQQLSLDKLTLERFNDDYKGDKEECKRRMFRYWLRHCEESSYDCLMQALVNAGETVAAENLHKKSGQFGVITVMLSSAY